jgi:transposase
MAYNLVPCDRDQQFLMPPSLDDWLPKDHLARFVVAVVETLDLSAFYARRRADGWGRAAYDPRMMVALLIYAYATGARSSRLIERRCIEDIAFRFISANEAPDHATTARFAQDHESELADLFDQVLRLAAEVGLLKVGLVALDSTRMKANASAGANRGADWIRHEVERIIAEARATDEEEDARLGEASPSDVPEELAEPNTRLARLLAAKARLEADEAERQAAYEAKLAGREEYAKRTGKGMRGRKPKPPTERLRDRERSKVANTTDPDSRTMGAANGGFVQGYNAQAVATKEQIVVACAVTTNSTDYGQLEPMVDQAKENLARAGVGQKIGVVVGDAGYVTEDNLGLEEELGVELVIATRNRKRAGPGEQPRPRGRIPGGLSRTQRMDRKLRTKRGERLYRRRGGAIEPVFGQERQRGAGHFRRRGLTACASEWRFEQTVHNLLKIRTSGKWTAPGGTPSPTRPSRRSLRSAHLLTCSRYPR